MKKKTIYFLIIATAAVFLLAAGLLWLYSHGLLPVSSTTQPQEGQIKIACVGDSITYGYGTSSWPDNSYPVQLQLLLGNQYHVNNFGFSGATLQDSGDLPYCKMPPYEDSLSYQPDIVILMLGSNDTKPDNWHGSEPFRAALNTMLDRYQGAQLYLCTPASAFFLNGQTEGVAMHNIQPLIAAEAAQIVRQVAAERNLPLIDIHALTAQNPQWFTDDGVHPSNAGAKAIAQAVFDALQ